MATALLDSNVLVHAAYDASPLHAAASRLVAAGLHQRGLFCISPQNLVEFAAVTTRRRFVDPPISGEAVERMTSILYSSRRLRKVYPSRGAVRLAMQEGARLGISGPAWYDLYLAITMRGAGIREIVTDNVRDFDRIPFVTARRLEGAA